MNLELRKDSGTGVLRIGLALVFLWFGSNQLLFTKDWLVWLPPTAFHLPISAEALVMLNGSMEVALGLLLLLGLFTRVVALLLALHLLPIILTVGYNDVGVRDFGLMMAMFSVVISGPGRWCLDARFKERLMGKKLLKLLYFFETVEQ